MSDSIFWNYLEELPEQEAAWIEWERRLASWHRFNTLYTHYLRVEGHRVKQFNCPSPCEQGYPRRVVENSPSDIKAVCPEGNAETIQLKFRDILIYALRQDVLHMALCGVLQIERPSYNKWAEFGSTWYLGDYYDAASKLYYTVYLTYRAATLPEAINSLCHLHHEPFVLMTPTLRVLVPEAKQQLADKKSILLPMDAELNLQPDGSFKTRRSIAECIAPCNHRCQQPRNNKNLPIDVYKYLVYSDL